MEIIYTCDTGDATGRRVVGYLVVGDTGRLVVGHIVVGRRVGCVTGA